MIEKSQAKKGGRPTIGVLAGWGVYAPNLHNYLDSVFRGIRAAAQDRGCNLLQACGVARRSDMVAGGPAWPLPSPVGDFVPVGPWNTNGLIVTLPFGNESMSHDVHQIMADGHPVVFIGSGEDGPAVVLDNEGGIRQAVAHLAEHGHRRIAFIAGPEDALRWDPQGDIASRARAYRAAIQELGLEADPALLVHEEHNIIGGRRGMRRLLESGVSFTAVATSNDEGAIGAMQVLKKAGLRIPQDIAVVGFDDIFDALAQEPPLTTVYVPTFEMGYHALEMALDQTAGDSQVVRVPARLAIRQSCGCPHGIMASIPPKDLERWSSGDPETAKLQLAQKMAESVYQNERYLNLDQLRSMCKRLVEAFVLALTEKEAWEDFRSALQDILQQVREADDDPHPWQAAISLLEEGMSVFMEPHPPAEELRRAERALHQARVIISASTQWQHREHVVRHASVTNQASLLSLALRAAQDENQFLEALKTYLPVIGVQHAIVASYEPEGDDPWAFSLLQPVCPEGAPIRFPTRQFPPPGLYPADRPFLLAVLPLVVRGKAQGFVVFDSNSMESYGIIARQLAGDYERRQAEEALAKAYAEVEKQVEERTAELQQEIAERRRAQEESARLQQQVIAAQQQAIQELSTPIIPILERVIIMPLIGSIDSMRARDITRKLLAGIRRHRARVVILDITGVPIVDSGVASHLNKTIQAARLKGARTIITGVSDAVAETIVDLGIDWSNIETLSDLQTGLRVALATMERPFEISQMGKPRRGAET